MQITKFGYCDLNSAALSTFFKAVSDPVRLRMLHLLNVEELSVSELVRILDIPQSSVSRHLKQLKEQGLVSDRPVGPATFYRAALDSRLGNGESALRESFTELLSREALPPADRRGIDRVVAMRRSEGEAFFDHIGVHWDALREECFGPTFHLESMVRLLPAEWIVADLGTGTGYLLPILGAHFSKVIALDNNQSMLDLARRRVEEAGVHNVDLRLGRLEQIPMTDAEADLTIAFLMLHHLEDIPGALAEMARVLKPEGRLLLVEIEEHDNESFRIRMGDRRAGIPREELAQALTGAGFSNANFWNVAQIEHPEHEPAPIPKLYGVTAKVCSLTTA